jgi:hypothetical protein
LGAEQVHVVKGIGRHIRGNSVTLNFRWSPNSHFRSGAKNRRMGGIKQLKKLHDNEQRKG